MLKASKFKNGLTLIYNYLDLKSTSFMVKVGVGSRNEKNDEWGTSHFIEHVLFKGTPKRTELQIAEEFEANGIEFNAYTSFQDTVFYFKSINEKFLYGVDIISDMFFNTIFDCEGFENERKVILNEYSLYNDKPSEKVKEIANSAVCNGTNYEHDIIGTESSIKSITPAKLEKYYKEHYIASNVIISYCGNLEFEKVVDVVEKYFNKNFKTEGEISTVPEFKFNPIYFTKAQKESENSYVTIGFPAFLCEDEYFKFIIMDKILSGGMSSRFFDRIRNQLGLCYNIRGITNDIDDFRYIYYTIIATKHEDVKKLISELFKLYEEIKLKGITIDELNKAKTQIKSELIFKSEGSMGNCRQNIYDYVTFKRIMPVEEQIKLIEKIEPSEINCLVNKIFDFQHASLAIVEQKIDDDLQNYWNNEKEKFANREIK